MHLRVCRHFYRCKVGYALSKQWCGHWASQVQIEAPSGLSERDLNKQPISETVKGKTVVLRNGMGVECRSSNGVRCEEPPSQAMTSFSHLNPVAKSKTLDLLKESQKINDSFEYRKSSMVTVDSDDSDSDCEQRVGH